MLNLPRCWGQYFELLNTYCVCISPSSIYKVSSQRIVGNKNKLEKIMQNEFELSCLFKGNKRKTEDVIVRVLYARQKDAVIIKIRVAKNKGG